MNAAPTSVRPASRDAPLPAIRPARADDAESIRQIHVSSVHALCGGHYSPQQLIALLGGRDAADYRAAIDDLGEYVVVAEDPRSRLTGFAALYSAEVRAVYAAPDAVRGTGRLLLAALESEALRRHVGALTLSSSLNALGFYEAMGYRRVSPALLTLADGVSMAVWSMSKRLR